MARLAISTSQPAAEQSLWVLSQCHLSQHCHWLHCIPTAAVTNYHRLSSLKLLTITSHIPGVQKLKVNIPKTKVKARLPLEALGRIHSLPLLAAGVCQHPLTCELVTPGCVCATSLWFLSNNTMLAFRGPTNAPE
jgi:hypothetical protein